MRHTPLARTLAWHGLVAGNSSWIHCRLLQCSVVVVSLRWRNAHGKKSASHQCPVLKQPAGSTITITKRMYKSELIVEPGGLHYRVQSLRERKKLNQISGKPGDI